ncbi:MAG: bifunctional [glutamine synthetase] adenylyltransferase/[glutamine synthetase]-adenylyl-L-tyrosine phosphorylase [Rhodospirillales bacterium]|nr:bifunctional [glutamine synthetase] adenylyltransferase/[glutamine synthetase]-adenylyl-L-tyrosine phosphorylase [Rhodospirillales bacterium]
MTKWLANQKGDLPLPADPERAGVGLERWLTAAAAAGPQLVERARAQAGERAVRRLLDALFGNSPYLTFLCEREPGLLAALIGDGPDPAMAAIWRNIGETKKAAARGEDPSRALRIAKRRVALVTAVADIAGVWSLAQVTEALARFAEDALGCACAFLLRELVGHVGCEPAVADAPEIGSGLIVLGMGKLGALELNYSSDIDLIVFYDPECLATDRRDELQNRFVRLARGLVRIMAQRNADGYVFRTDLRLRPDPGSTPPAMSVLAAEIYYETLGQNWERAAMIKARPVAGDREAGRLFVEQLRPFIWRKNLDFAAIRDIHSIKRQIHAHRGGGKIAVAGHNIKLGRGGIREIEFFVQTQQLIWGGRVPALRLTGTEEALLALVAAGKVGEAAAQELIAAYRFLRRVEHRLQMINDAQTHALPDEPAALGAVAVFLGFADRRAFAEALLHHLHNVERHYADLFEDAPALSAAGFAGNLVFTGGEPDPDTLATLARLGFVKVEMVDAAVRGWHHGRSRAMRSPRARELLTELMPFLLKGIAETPDPDATLVGFDRFLAGLPAGVQLFSMFHANPELLRLVIHIMGVAPGLATTLARAPAVLESVLSADFFQEPPSLADLQIELEGVLARARDEEEILDAARRWAGERNFQVGVQSLNRLIGTGEAQIAWSNVADAALRGLLPRVEAAFAAAYGVVPGCGLAVVAMGKLGSREMTRNSDLDLIFVYTTPDPEAASDGPRPLSASQYFARLSQRFINALTAPTSEGRLYEVDMRLRPSGKAGPIATSFASFERYHQEQAWTWEQMALTRARVIAGPRPLVGDIERAIREALMRPRDADRLRADVADMRERIEHEHHAASVWEVKHVRGGLVDIEFVAQYLQLRHAYAAPQVLSTNTMEALGALSAAGFLAADVAEELIEALAFWQQIQARLRLTFNEPLRAPGGEDGTKALREAFRDIAGSDLGALTRRMEATATMVLAHFDALVGAAGGEGLDEHGER